MVKFDVIDIIEQLENLYLNKVIESSYKGVELSDDDWNYQQAVELRRLREELKVELMIYNEMIENRMKIDMIDIYEKRRMGEARYLLKRMEETNKGNIVRKNRKKDILREELDRMVQIDAENKRVRREIYKNDNMSLFMKEREFARFRFGNIDDEKFLIHLNELNGVFKRTLLHSTRGVLDAYQQIPKRAMLMKATDKITMKEAVFTANKDFVDNGLNYIRYSNGAMHNIRSYSEMVVRTNRQRAGQAGEAFIRQRAGFGLVITSHYGGSCPLCAPYQGRVFIDDVFNTPSDETLKLYSGKYPLLSKAVDGGMFHPNCRHSTTAFDPEFLEYGDELIKREYTEEDKKYYDDSQVQRRYEREIRKLKRERLNYNKAGLPTEKIDKKIAYRQFKIRELIDENPKLKRKYWRERIIEE